MAENKLKERWQAGKAAVNGWLAIPAGFSAEVMAQCGWDSVTVDMQHGVQDYQTMVQCFQAMDRLPVTKLVRVPWNEPGIVGKVLDAGAYGVICPMVNTREEAAALVSYCRYPPKGQRSNGPIRAGTYGVAGTYQQTANDEILVIPMIETRQAVENIDQILDVPGIDSIYVGPADLAFSLGKTPKLDSEDAEQLGMYEVVVAACRKRGIHPGIHCIETRQAVGNIDEILDVPGIDPSRSGPADLAFSLGKTPKLDSEDAEQLGMYEVVLAACRKRGIHPGIHCAEPAYAARMIRMGFRLTTIANDSGLMAKAAREAVAGVWREVGEFR